jgi:uncharacterized caspase-like protein
MADTGVPGRRALIIATGRHDNPGIHDLMGPVFDAAAMSSTLQKLGGFTVDLLLIDRPARELLNRIEAFLFSFDEQETALVYFSGHGFKSEDGALWLAATGVRPHAMRFDVVEVLPQPRGGPRVRHIRGAF